MSPARSLLVLMALALAGCVHRSPLARLSEPTPLALVVLVDDRDGTHFDAAPESLKAALARELERRNLTAEPVAASLLAPLAENRNSQTRAALLGAALPPRRLFLLVELQAQFFDQFEGGYKWNVDGHLAVGAAGDLAATTQAGLTVPVFLQQDHERGPEALAEAVGGLAERVGVLLDDHFAGRAEAEKPGARP